MSSIFWPGDARAGDLFSEATFVTAMIAVESAWVGEALHPPAADLAQHTGAGGNPVIPLVEALRAANPDLAERLHRGLTSQDVLDTALILMLRDTVAAIAVDVRRQLDRLDVLGEELGATPMMGRTLTQPAQPITFGHKLHAWRAGIVDAAVDLQTLRFPVQCGGPVGLGVEGRALLANRLGLEDAEAWHTGRRVITRAGDALVALTDAWGRIARDVLELGRPETGELREGVGGGSSSMPHKHNPVLAVLIRRAALAAPMLGAALHLAAAEQVDERADGSWHAEWDTLRLLARRTAVAGSQATDLLEDLQVDTARMAARAAPPTDGPAPRHAYPSAEQGSPSP